MSLNTIPWRYRLEVRQAVPILIGLAGILVLLLTQGYLYAREQIIATVHAQVAQLEGSIVRQEEYSRRWLDRGMHPLVRLAAALPRLQPMEQYAVDERIISIISDERGRQIVDIHYLDGKGGIHLRRYSSQGLLYAGGSVGENWTAQTIQAVKAPLWHAPELDAEGNLTLRYSVPFLEKRSEGDATIGICSVSLAMPWFTERVLSFSSFENSIVFILAPNGAWTLPTHHDPALARLKGRMLATPSGSGESSLNWEGRSYTAVYMPLTGGTLRLGILIPRKDLFSNLDRLTHLLGVIGLTVLLLAAYSLHRTTAAVLRPFKPLGQLAERLARGELESVPDGAIHRLSSRFPNEAERLRQATETLRQALRQRVRDLTLAGQTRERLFGELAFARTLQESLRPKELPPTPNLEVATFVHTAGNVCGDMYDYFYQSPQHLCCIMGNVVERGVPAALLTGRVIPLLHELLLSQITPGKALENVNRVLASSISRDQSMVSVLAGVLDMESGQFRWACAGQLPPFRSLGDEVEQLAWTGNVPLGIRLRERYVEQQIWLRPGEILFFTEQRLLSASDRAGRAYGEDALRRFLTGRTETLTELLRTLYAQIHSHVGGPPQDDLTFFAVRWRGESTGKQTWQ